MGVQIDLLHDIGDPEQRVGSSASKPPGYNRQRHGAYQGTWCPEFYEATWCHGEQAHGLRAKPIEIAGGSACCSRRVNPTSSFPSAKTCYMATYGICRHGPHDPPAPRADAR